MKKSLFILFILISGRLLSQDSICLINKTILEGKVTEINEGHIKYRLASNLTGPLYTLSKKQVSFIIYANGIKEVIDEDYVNQKAPKGSSGFKANE